MTNKGDIVRLNDLVFTYPGSSQPVLSIPEFAVIRGQSVFLRGASGSGKTTLLSLIAAVLQPDSGTIDVDDVSLYTLQGGQRDTFRAERIGLVFQQFNLLPFLSVQDNVLLPCRFSKQRREAAGGNSDALQKEASRLLNAMQLPTSIASQPVNKLSVGQQQRVAVARALIGRPPLIIADEPTSALDTDNRQAFLDLLFAEIEAAGCSLLFVSHDVSLASRFDRLVDLTELNKAATSTDRLMAQS